MIDIHFKPNQMKKMMLFVVSCIPSFHHSVMLLLHHSIIPSFHHSITPSFHRGIGIGIHSGLHVSPAAAVQARRAKAKQASSRLHALFWIGGAIFIFINSDFWRVVTTDDRINMCVFMLFNQLYPIISYPIVFHLIPFHSMQLDSSFVSGACASSSTPVFSCISHSLYHTFCVNKWTISMHTALI